MFATDLRQCFAPRRVPVYVLLAASGIMLVVQQGELPPLIVAWIIALSALELQFNNMLYRTTSELELLTLLPLSWRGIIVAKNLATIIASLIVGPVIAISVLYFSPRQPDAGQVVDAALFFWSVLFLLLIIGNLRSVLEPRKENRRTGDAVIQAAGMAALVIVCGFPYVALVTLGGSRMGCLLFGCAAALTWWRRSIPHAAANAEDLLARQ